MQQIGKYRYYYHTEHNMFLENQQCAICLTCTYYDAIWLSVVLIIEVLCCETCFNWIKMLKSLLGICTVIYHDTLEYANIHALLLNCSSQNLI